MKQPVGETEKDQNGGKKKVLWMIIELVIFTYLSISVHHSMSSFSFM